MLWPSNQSLVCPDSSILTWPCLFCTNVCYKLFSILQELRVKAALSCCQEEDLLDFKLLKLLRTMETFEVGSHFDLGDKIKTLEHEGESYELK